MKKEKQKCARGAHCDVDESWGVLSKGKLFCSWYCADYPYGGYNGVTKPKDT